MSYPNSKVIDAIKFSDLAFLTDNYATTISASDFDLDTGKPLNNITVNAKVNPFFLNVVSQSLSENRNVHDKFIFDYPNVLELDSARDLQVAGTTTIDAVFVTEGASMWNMFGYYFYYEDGDGNRHILDNDGEVGDYYYRPTVVFPYVYSEPGDTSTIQRGDARRLKGNLSSGLFSDIWVGFFLIPHGWFAFKNSSPIPDDMILYSTLDFCSKYVDNQYQMVNDKIYSVYTKSVNDHGDELLLVAFEDVFYQGTYNMDYNDCVIGLEMSHVENIANYDQFATIEIPVPKNYTNIVFIDEHGEYFEIDPTVHTVAPDTDYRFERIMKFDNATQRDNTYDIVVHLLGNYSTSIEKIDAGISDFQIKTTYLFRKNDLKNNKKPNGRHKLYILEVKFNGHLAPIVNQYARQLGINLGDSNYSECYRLYPEEDEENPVIDVSNVDIDPPRQESPDNFRIIGNGVMDTKNGKSHLPFKTVTNYKAYKRHDGEGNGLTINIGMGNHPDGYQLGNKTFVRYIGFVVDTNEHLVIDLADLGLYQVIGGVVTAVTGPSFNSIAYSDVQVGSTEIKELVSIFRNNSGATYRVVTINENMPFYCIRFPNIKNNPTMIYLDGELTVNWADKTSLTGGTYFNKQQFYPVATLDTF